MKVNELTGHALDWAVAKCEGRTWYSADNFLAYYEEDSEGEGEVHYAYNWAEGGPIIGREKIELFIRDEKWFAYSSNSTPKDFYGETPLIAAMRCYVASKLGDEVEIPTELTQGETK